MMQTFKLKKGEIKFEEDKIVIVDDALKNKQKTLFKSSLWTFFGIMSVLRYLKTGDQFLLWTGLLIGIGHFVILLLTLFRTSQSVISFNDVKLIKIRQGISKKFLDIQLTSNRIRRVSQVDNAELLKYVETNFSSAKLTIVNKL